MNYESIQVNSDTYKKLSNEEKLKVVKACLENLFAKGLKKTVTVIYKGKKRQISKEKIGEFKDLAEREKLLERVVKKTPLYTILLSDEEYKNMTTKQKIEVIKAKIKRVKELGYVKDKTIILDNLNRILKTLESENISNNCTSSKQTGVADTYITLSNEEKLEAIRTKIENLFEYKGKGTIIVIYKGKKKQIYKHEEGIYRDLVEREKALEKNISKTSSTTNLPNNNIKKTKTKNYILPLVVGISALTTKFAKKSKAAISSFGNKFAKKLKKVISKTKTSFKKIKTLSENNNKTRVIKRRIAAGICALTITIGGLIALKSCKKACDNTESTKEGTTQTQPTTNGSNKEHAPNDNTSKEENKKPIINEDNKNNDTITNEDNKENITINDDSLSLNDTITINKGSYIYTNSYDATYNTNSYNPYYSGHYERDVQGLVYEHNGNIYVIYENDTNALEKQKQLENSGAVITAVLVTRSDLIYTGEYEGYYNVNSIKVKKR